MVRTFLRLLRALLLAGLTISSTSSSWAAGAEAPGSSPRLAEGASWPMLAANPQRTSWTPEEIRGNLAVDWYRPIEPYVPYKIQPIAANGTIYVSSAGGLYAFRASNGDLLWVYPTELPLGHSPTIATVNGKSVAYVGGYDRKIHAIDALGGQPIPGYIPYEAEAGFETNPLVIDNTLYAGNRDGNFYALDAVTGAFRWKFATQGPILVSAAYKDGVVYFASGDAYAYGLEASSGALLWKSGKFPGQGFHSFWPVAYTEKKTGKDYVVFTAGDNYRQSDLADPLPQMETYAIFAGLAVGDYISPAGNETGSGTYWGHDAQVFDVSRITDYYEDNAHRRIVFVLDGGNGQEFTFDSDQDGKREYAPFTLSGVTMSGSKYPPVINGIDNVYYQSTAFYNGGWVSRGDPVGWKFGTDVVSRVATGNGPGSGIGHASDEPSAYASGGRIMYWDLCCDREGGAYDVTIPFGEANRDWYYWGYNMARNELAPGYQQMYNDGTPLYGNMDGWQIYSGKNQSKNGVYGKHGSTQSPPIPYQGRVYFLRGNSLMAFSPTAAGTKTPLPLATRQPVSGGPSSVSTAELNQRLEVEIQKMLAAGHLQPGYHGAGFFDLFGTGDMPAERDFGEIFDYFQNPSDTVVALLQAMPHLSPTLQEQVKTYLQTYYGPGAPYSFTTIVHIGWKTGAAREAYDIPPDVAGEYTGFDKLTRARTGKTGWASYPPFSFYAAWKYALVFGGAKGIFDSMSGRLENPPGDTFFSERPYVLNLYIAGYQGYLELQKLAGYPEDGAKKATYTRLLNLRAGSFSKDTPYALPPYSDDGFEYFRTLSVARNFMYLTPELGEFLRQAIQGTVRTAVDEYGYVAPYWFVAKFDDALGESTLQHLYDVPAMFQAKAWILMEPREELVKYLDVPAFPRGDLFYIQNLVAAIEADAAGPSPTFSDVPFSHPYHDDIEALYQAGYTAGCNTNPLRYCPDVTMNRAESAVFVERGIHATSYEPATPSSQVFADLPLDSWAAKWVDGLWKDQYTSGCGTNPLVYCPWQGHSRAEGCVFYMRMLNGATYAPPTPTGQTFADVPLEAWYAGWVQSAYDAGLINACQETPDRRFCPGDPLTRALAAHMMVEAKGLTTP